LAGLIFGPLAVASVLVPMFAIGYGLPIACFLLGAVFIAPLIVFWIGERSRRPWVSASTSLCGVVLITSAICWFTSHPAAEPLFRSIFGQPPPAGVKDVRARKQFWDGNHYLLSFHANEKAFSELERSSLTPWMESDELVTPGERGNVNFQPSFGVFGAMMLTELRDPTLPRSATRFFKTREKPVALVVHDDATGQTYVLQSDPID
jgi:hypothetical protein